MIFDITTLTDSYNASHYKMYPEGTTELSGYIEARDNSIFKNISFFGLQYFLKLHLMDLSRNLRHNDLEFTKKLWNMHGLPFNIEDWETIKDEYNGVLPIEIQAVPEGSWIPKGNVLCQVRNTDSRFPWLTTWIETMLVQSIWYPSSIATLSKECKIMMKQYLKDTGCENIDQVLPFMLHDFGFRGASSLETACLGDAAHLTNFMGTDTFPSKSLIDAIYTDYNFPTWGYSIPASNHAVITSYGNDNEDEAFQKILDQYLGPGKTVACVSDSYNLWRAIDSFGTKFKKQIEESGGRLVVRPDSGPAAEYSTRAIEQLMGLFGYTVNSKGYKVLPNCIRLIWSDGLNKKCINDVLKALKNNKIAAENITFGVGSALLQEVNRDMGSFAFKVNEIVVNGECRPVCKTPITSSTKSSKPGRLALIKENDEYKTINECDLGDQENLLVTVYKNGELLVDHSFTKIRKLANEGI